jgi:hypothetical protein
MSLYLNTKLVELSFKRLAPRSTAGKKSLERTSALMYFLAFDAAVKNLDYCPLDLNPRSVEGKNNRNEVELEYVKLVQLKPSEDGQVRHIVTLGRIDKGGNSPEKRISSNFFTVPVKKASEASTVYNYPNRPAPLLKMGLTATDMKWGVDYHDDWETSLPKLLVELKGSSPFTDLAIFVTRNDPLPEGTIKLNDALSYAVHNRFSEKLAIYWVKRMDAEKVFFKHGEYPFQPYYSDPLAVDNLLIEGRSSDKEVLQTLDKKALVDRVVYLEGLLDVQNIEYRSITE